MFVNLTQFNLTYVNYKIVLQIAGLVQQDPLHGTYIFRSVFVPFSGRPHCITTDIFHYGCVKK